MKGIQEKGFGTKAIHGGAEKNPFGTLTTPIYQSSTFVFDSAEQGGKRFALEEAGYIYSRLGNPTSSVVEGKLALLEGAEAALATSSGMGAISSTMWTLLKAGDHVLADKTLYGCTYAFLCHGLTKFGIDVEFVDTSDLEAVKKAMKSNTRIVYLETPANPNLKVVDVKAVCEIAHENEGTKVIVDNTFATPYLQNPIKLGADLVVHSATKYLNGHGDVVAGFVAGDLETVTQIRLVGVKDMTGSVLSPQDAFLMIRGMKTLELRMERHCSNAGEIARFLDAHPMIEKVYYPGLESHEGHEIAKEQMNGFGGIIAFDVKGGLEAGKKLLNSLELCTLAVSLGDTETLIQHPASMTHSPYTVEERAASGITEGLVRISVGLEGVNDIIDDLKQGLEKL
ncbi:MULTISPECIES: methionine gamma-lyase [Psychrilyobacter]|uniref:L-methionine gamma-lyase n=3 Tax=Psychrilyobacter TaxID=623282 RepID=A0ABX9KHB3_9FUSO|nr:MULTISPECIES: methionine gamma-lyase [Psychrilyobacter]NDI77973.1 methionine gamma-lyase [Psychrilyobacter piezotolerans]RDE61917.1 methionine gamma-lyase [Psychrilyobacter sp. S5]REI41143.1 methionine gamma-lyase [Psychrilyobacter piezotolerans]